MRSRRQSRFDWKHRGPGLRLPFTACFLFCLLLFSKSPCSVDLITTTRRFAQHTYYQIDILPMARRQGTPTLASGIFLLPWRLACTVPLLAGSYIRLHRREFPQALRYMRNRLSGPDLLQMSSFCRGQKWKPTHPSPKQGLASIPCLDSQGSYARYDKILLERTYEIRLLRSNGTPQ